jgi:hypothetical protein
MHVLQWIAVEVEDQLEDPEQEAMQLVETFLNSEMGGNDYSTNAWYDWFVIGGGRWNPEQDPYSSSSNMIISYEKDPEGFAAKIADCIENRKNEYAEYAKQVDYSAIQDKLDSYTGTMDYSFDLYPLKKCIDMLQGEWDFNAYFYDAINYSTNPKHILDKPERLPYTYLIPVDFHF